MHPFQNLCKNFTTNQKMTCGTYLKFMDDFFEKNDSFVTMTMSSKELVIAFLLCQ